MLCPPAAAAATAQVSAGPAHADIAGDSVDELPAVALAERVGDFNISMDPWEQTGAAPQGWATHLHQTVIPVQRYIQLRPHDTTLPSFGGGPVRILVATAEASLAILRQIMTITFATIVSRGYCFLNEFRSGRCRSCLFAIYGALSVLLNDAALGALISITYAWSVKDEELSSSPLRGARTHGLPMMTDWKSLEASCCPIHTDSLCNGEWYILTVVVTC